MASAIQAIKRLHKLGLVHNDIAKGDSLHVREDGFVRIVKFSKVGPFVGANGRHIAGPDANYRKTDMEQLGGMVSTELQFQDELIKDFFIHMESLGREETPDYDVWIEQFLLASHGADDDESVSEVLVEGSRDGAVQFPSLTTEFDIESGGSALRGFEDDVSDQWLLLAHNL
jgi:hypothetical protein